MAENRQYDQDYKVQAVRLAKAIGQAKAAKELGIPTNTLYGWVRANRRLKKENDFLEEASAFFAASRLKSVRTKE